MGSSVAPGSAVTVPRDLLDGAETLTGALRALATRHPDLRALTIVARDGSERGASAADLWARAERFARVVRARRLAPGSVVLLVLPTGVDLVACYFGTMLAGAVPGLLAGPTHRLSEPDAYRAHVRGIVESADAALLCVDADTRAILADDPALAARALVAPDADAPADGAPFAPADPAGIATVQYSSGSTGRPKGVLLTHRAMLNNVRAVRDGLALDARDVSVNWIPLYHDMGLIDALLLPLLVGCRTVLIPTVAFMRDPVLWLRAVERHRGTISWAPNFAYALCADRIPARELGGLDLASWRIAINAAEPVLAPTIARFTARFAAHGFAPEAMTPAWGLAENVTIATAQRPSTGPVTETIDRAALATDGVARPVAAGDGFAAVASGTPLPRCALEIRNDAGDVLPERHAGTVWLRSDSLFAGYHRDPEHTRRVLRDGWLDTGDRGYLAGGALFFVAREKDLLVIGGEKYAPHDVEAAINRVPGVREGCVVVVGVQNERRGTEDVAAIVETREDDEAARAALRDRIRHAAVRETGLTLRWVVLVPPGGVQKTTSGKLARDATRRRHADAFTTT